MQQLNALLHDMNVRTTDCNRNDKENNGSLKKQRFNNTIKRLQRFSLQPFCRFYQGQDATNAAPPSKRSGKGCSPACCTAPTAAVNCTLQRART